MLVISPASLLQAKLVCTDAIPCKIIVIRKCHHSWLCVRSFDCVSFVPFRTVTFRSIPFCFVNFFGFGSLLRAAVPIDTH